MHLIKGTIKGSPFIGIHALATDSYCLVPKGIYKKEALKLKEALELELIKAQIGATSLIGCLAAGNKKGLVVSSIIEEKELTELKSFGLKVKVIEGYSALGNLIALNDNGLLLSSLLSEGEKKAIKEFFGLPAIEVSYGVNALIGSSTIATNNGFIVHPKAEKEDFEKIKKALKVTGIRTTANYGDPFVRNSIIANNFGAFVGLNTSGPELVRIDEGLSGGFE